jgi:hypothetical protein
MIRMLVAWLLFFRFIERFELFDYNFGSSPVNSVLTDILPNLQSAVNGD